MKPPRSIRLLFPKVKKCSDAKLPVEVRVTAGDSSSGKKKDFGECALARAICREWKADAAVIGLSYSYVIKGNHAMRFVTPDTVKREIVSFDRSKKFAPGQYHLAAIPESQRRKPPSGPRDKKRKHGPKRRVFHKESVDVRQMSALGAA